MKKTSKTRIKSISTLLLLSILIAVPFSCKKMDSSMNVDQKALPYGPYVPAALLQTMEFNIIKCDVNWQYQLQQNLNADCYSQYMTSPTAFAGNQNNITYAFVDGWNGFISSILYDNVLNPWLEVRAATKDKNTDMDLYSISLIIKVMAAARVTDVFGPLPYTLLGKGTNIAWDSQQTLYNTFFDELKTAIDQLTFVENATPNLDVKWAAFDKTNLGGDYKKWVQVANTLRLRLAIRIAKKDPARAKTEAEAAVIHPFGLLEATPLNVNSGANNVIADIANSWGDIKLCATMGSLLTGYADPRLEKYATPATDAAVAGQFIGIRQGIDITDNTTYRQLSSINLKTTDPLQIMSGAESFFLRAEGALNGWTMNGTADNFYKKGVETSFVEHGLTAAAADTYLADMVNNKAAAYVDPHNPANNVPIGSPYLSTIPKQFGGTADQQLEEIITQKWIAMFPEGMEAWSEFRRTGYPKLWPVVKSYNADIPAGEFVNRLPYPSSLKTTAPDQYNAAVKLLGGPDNGYTKLWWAK